jgi:hypothetical protein
VQLNRSKYLIVALCSVIIWLLNPVDKGERDSKVPLNKATALNRFTDGLLVAVAEKATPLLTLVR